MKKQIKITFKKSIRTKLNSSTQKKFDYDLSSDDEEEMNLISPPKKFDYDLSSDDEEEMNLACPKKFDYDLSSDEEGGEYQVWSGCYLDLIPDEILILIGGFLGWDHKKLRVICKRFYRVFSDISLVTLTNRQFQTVKLMKEKGFYQYKTYRNARGLPYSFSGINAIDPLNVISSGVGTGKTIMALRLIKDLFDQGKIERVMIMTPVILFDEWIKSHKRWGVGLPGIYAMDKNISNLPLNYLEDKKIILVSNRWVNDHKAFEIAEDHPYKDEVLEFYARNDRNNYYNNRGPYYQYIKRYREYKYLTAHQRKMQRIANYNWDLIMCDDIGSSFPHFLEILMGTMFKENYPFRLFGLNASDNRQKNLVNHGVDEQLPEKPKLKIDIKYVQTTDKSSYMYRSTLLCDLYDLVNLELDNVLASNNKTIVFSDTYFYNRQRIDGYIAKNKDKDYVCLNNVPVKERREILVKYEKDKSSSQVLFSFQGNSIKKGHNIYPKELIYITDNQHFKPSSLYQLIGRIHRVFSPYKEVKITFIVLAPFYSYGQRVYRTPLDDMYQSRNNLYKNIGNFIFFFSEYLHNPNADLSGICKHLKNKTINIKDIDKVLYTANGSSKYRLHYSDFLELTKKYKDVNRDLKITFTPKTLTYSFRSQ